MKIKNNLKKIIALSMIMGIGFANNAHNIPISYAIEEDGKGIDETGQNDLLINDIAYGKGLNENTKSETTSILKVSGEENIVDVYGVDVDKFLGFNGTPDSNLISSVKVKSLNKGSGVNVNILTPENITRVTKLQYENAAITAGATDVDIEVASPVMVTGESALAGVYKIIENKGIKIDPERTQLAQDELNTLVQIDADNDNKEGYDSDKTSEVFTTLKQELAKEKAKKDENLTKEEIKELVEKAIKENNLGNVLSNNNIELIVNYFDKYQNSDVIDSKEVLDNLSKISKELGGKAKNYYENNKEEIDKLGNDIKESGFLERIIKLVKDFFASFGNDN